MKVPARFAPVIFSALLSAIMVCVVSGSVLAMNQGIDDQFLQSWMKSCVTTWPIAFPTVMVVAPLVRKVVKMVTYEG